jgi:endonuclease/exonuclease/phosphatase family metal-dependent hydrolase
MNYWKERRGSNAKTLEQKKAWKRIAKDLLLNDDYFDMFVLQESSINILGDDNTSHITEKHQEYSIVEHNNKHFYFHTNPKKYPEWGLLIISKICNGILDKFDNELAFMCYNFMVEDKKITVVNVHLQKDYDSKLYYPSLKTLITRLRQILQENNNHPILLMGDLNASDKFSSNELSNFKDAFTEIRNIGFFDCTESIPLENRSTMLDVSFQNDYVFINRPFIDNIFEINIRKDIETEYIDHYPIDFKIKL